MVLEHTETLHTIAQVTITLIGFSGIVVVIGERAVTKWSPEEWIRIYALIAPTLTAFFCSFVPILVAMLTSPDERVWRISNGILGLAHLANIVPFYVNPKKAKLTFGQRFMGIIGFSTIAAHFLVAFGLLPWAAFIYVFGLLQQTWIGLHNFLLLFQPGSKDAA